MEQGISRVPSMSKDLTEEARERLKSVFPECFSEGKLDIDKLLNLCGEFIDNDFEKYKFEWKGKSECYHNISRRSNGTLRPCIDESVDFDNTKNIYIEGDNLEVLKLLQRAYFNSIKMIYIDPPYNTGNDFVYEDDYKDPIERYKEVTSQTTKSNPETMGRFHTNWLNMMYPRLRLAANLLRDDGVIAVNIDEHEIVNLLKLMDEVFGEENNLGVIVWDKRNPKGDAKGIAYQHEYIVFYAKNRITLTETNSIKRQKKNAAKILEMAEKLYSKLSQDYTLDMINADFNSWINSQTDFSGGEKAYNKIDDKGQVYQTVSMSWPNKKEAPKEYFMPLIHPKTNKPCPIPERGWRNPPKTMQDLLSKDLIIFGEDETTQPRRKYLLKENMYENLPSLAYYGGSDIDLLKSLGIPFDTPKVVELIKEHLSTFTKDNDIILDFFSGSATTAHAVMELNAEDNGNRQFICVQLPELCDEKSEAYKAGYKNICEIGKERIGRAGKKILDCHEAKASRNDSIRHCEERIFASAPCCEAARHDNAEKSAERQNCESNFESGVKTFACKNPREQSEDVAVQKSLIPDSHEQRHCEEQSDEAIQKSIGLDCFTSVRNDEMDYHTDKSVRNDIIDTGFKVFKLDTSNLAIWDSSIPENADGVFSRLRDIENSIKNDRSDLDIVYEVMLKLGVPLDYKVIPIEINDKKAYSIGEDCLILICLDYGKDGITPEDIEKMCELLPVQIVSSQKSFKDDSALSNAYYILKNKDIEMKLL